jgi:hypothetical protein
MPHDILAMGLSSGTERHWPRGADNHDPKLSHNLSIQVLKLLMKPKSMDTTCLTLMWHHLACDKRTDLHDYFANFIGYPDVFIAMNGPWEDFEWKKEEKISSRYPWRSMTSSEQCRQCRCIHHDYHHHWEQ